MVSNAEACRHPAEIMRDAQNAKAGRINCNRGGTQRLLTFLLCDSLRPQRLRDENHKMIYLNGTEVISRMLPPSPMSFPHVFSGNPDGAFWTPDKDIRE